MEFKPGTAGSGGGLTFVSREGASPWDFTISSGNKNGAWHDTDLSSIVPADAVLVRLHAAFVSSVVGKTFGFRPHGWSLANGYLNRQAQVAGVQLDFNGEVPYGGPSEPIEFYVTDTNVGTAVFSVIGWWVQ